MLSCNSINEILLVFSRAHVLLYSIHVLRYSSQLLPYIRDMTMDFFVKLNSEINLRGDDNSYCNSGGSDYVDISGVDLRGWLIVCTNV